MKPNRTLLTLATESRMDTRRAQLDEQHRIDRSMRELLRKVVIVRYKQQRGDGI